MAASVSGLRVSAASRLVEEILHRCELEKPDGRPLYRYRVTCEHYERGRKLLNQNSAFIDAKNRPLCAVLALVTAEWYRREATSLWRKWSDIGVVPKDILVSDRNDIAEVGLAWWGQSPKISHQNSRDRREFLLSLAINGGLPSALVVGETGSRVRRFFEGVMADAQSFGTSPRISELLEVAEKHSHQLPDSYRDNTIFELTGELIAGLVDCRSKLPRDRLNANPAGWLDAHESGWRENLPIHLPEDPAACDRLFNNLLSIEPKARGNGIGLKRILVRTASGQWVQGFEVSADGVLKFDALAGQEEGRFRAYFAGSAARLVSQEFAQIYRSQTDQNGMFTVTSRAIGRKGFIGPVPFSEPVAATLVRDGKSLPPVKWPGGRALVSSCHIFKSTESAGRLELIGTGSFISALPTLVVLVRSDVEAIGHQGGKIMLIWQSAEECLWQIEGMALLTARNGDRFRVHAGAVQSEERRLEFEDIYASDIEMEDPSVLLVEAPLRPRMFGVPDGLGHKTSFLVFQRSGRAVKQADGLSGLVTVLWNDDEGFVVDRVKVLAMPRGFRLEGRIETAGCRVEWEGLPGWRVEPVDDHGASQSSAIGHNSLLCPWSDGIAAHRRIKLTDPVGAWTILRLRLQANRTLLVDADGKIRSEAPSFSPAELRGANLISDRAALIYLDLRDAGRYRALISRKVEGNTPMARFGNLAENLLGLSQERGPSILIQDDQSRKICTIRRSQAQPVVTGGLISFGSAGIDGAIGVARPLLAPSEEHALETLRDGCFSIPSRVNGPCLIFLRKGDAVITRPYLVDHPADLSLVAGLSPLDRIALVKIEEERRAAYRIALSHIAAEYDDSAQITHLVRIVNSMRNLSPRALDVTRELPSSPLLLCRMLLAANAEQLDSILTLERDLSFLWMAQSVEVWQNAAALEWRRIKAELGTVFEPDEAQKESTIRLVKRMEDLAERTGWFAGIRQALGFVSPISGGLMPLAQDHVRLHADDSDAISADIVEKCVRNIGLPSEISSLNFRRHTALVAPILLAGLATDRIKMSPPLAAGLRNALDIDAFYISSAFPHCLRILKP